MEMAVVHGATISFLAHLLPSCIYTKDCTWARPTELFIPAGDSVSLVSFFFSFFFVSHGRRGIPLFSFSFSPSTFRAFSFFFFFSPSYVQFGRRFCLENILQNSRCGITLSILLLPEIEFPFVEAVSLCLRPNLEIARDERCSG